MSTQEIKELKEEIAKLRERVAVLENRPTNHPPTRYIAPWNPQPPTYPPYDITCVGESK